MLCVRDVMHTDFCRVEKGESIADVARTLLFHNAECALVVDGEELLGIVTERDLLGIVTERDLLKAVLPTAAEVNEKAAWPLKKLRYSGVTVQSSELLGRTEVPHSGPYGRCRLTRTLVTPWMAPEMARVSRSSSAICSAASRLPWYHQAVARASTKKGHVAISDSPTSDASRNQ